MFFPTWTGERPVFHLCPFPLVISLVLWSLQSDTAARCVSPLLIWQERSHPWIWWQCSHPPGHQSLPLQSFFSAGCPPEATATQNYSCPGAALCSALLNFMTLLRAPLWVPLNDSTWRIQDWSQSCINCKASQGALSPIVHFSKEVKQQLTQYSWRPALSGNTEAKSCWASWPFPHPSSDPLAHSAEEPCLPQVFPCCDLQCSLCPSPSQYYKTGHLFPVWGCCLH